MRHSGWFIISFDIEFFRCVFHWWTWEILWWLRLFLAKFCTFNFTWSLEICNFRLTFCIKIFLDWIFFARNLKYWYCLRICLVRKGINSFPIFMKNLFLKLFVWSTSLLDESWSRIWWDTELISIYSTRRAVHLVSISRACNLPETVGWIIFLSTFTSKLWVLLIINVAFHCRFTFLFRIFKFFRYRWPFIYNFR